jgi:hypothetical protein
MGGIVKAKGLFQGTFEGAFQFEEEGEEKVMTLYFEGKIDKITNKIAIKQEEHTKNRGGGN